MSSAIPDTDNFLDRQLGELLLRLSTTDGEALPDKQQEQLARLTALASQSTRQGVIAAPLPAELEADHELLELAAIGQPGDYKPLIIEHGHVWLNRYWQYEQRLASNIRQRLHAFALPEAQTDSIQQTLSDWFPDEATRLQKQAVERAASTPFLIISGGPGTGKTTTVLRLLWLLVEQLGVDPKRILLAAPTGKAAMRMQEAIRQSKQALSIPAELANRIPEQGSTLHRLLGYIPGKVGFRHNSHNPLPAEVVIVDEASMIDLSLMTHLFEAVSPNARLILLGDRDQLASVETGSIFRDLCATQKNTDGNRHPLDAHIVVLEKSWRFTAGGGIAQLAEAVRDQQEQAMLELLQNPPAELGWKVQTRLESTQLQTDWSEYLQGIHSYRGQAEQRTAIFDAFNHFRILTPLRKGPLGTEQLNQSISRLMLHLLPAQNNGQWFAGRPVMVTENDYRQGLFNGDIGICLPDAQGQLRVWFADSQGSYRSFASVRLPSHETAWAMTIHKSQGSEFEQVLLLLPEDEDSQILGRELLYTGITRARSRLDIMGRLEVLRVALHKTLPDTSCIRWRLAN